MVERSTRFAMLVALPDGHHADVVADALAAKITTLPAALTRTVTWDQGHEMAAHTRFTEETGIEVYFCDPSRHGSAAATRTPTDSCASTCPASSTSAP
jgi:IS30 family transposase